MNDSTPWYRQFWPWFLIALPATAVVASFATLAIALSDPDPLVRDDWYAHGSRINQTLERERLAAEQDIRASLRLDDSGRGLQLVLHGTESVDSLTLALRHPTRGQRDIQLTLRRGSDGTFVGSADRRLDGTWDASLEPSDAPWGLRARIWLRPQAAAELGA